MSQEHSSSKMRRDIPSKFLQTLQSLPPRRAVKRRLLMGSSPPGQGKMVKRKSKTEAPPSTPSPLQKKVRSLCEKIRREHKARLKEDLTQLWASNRTNTSQLMVEHDLFQLQKGRKLCQVSGEDIYKATCEEAEHKSTTVGYIKVRMEHGPKVSEKLSAARMKLGDCERQKVPVAMISHIDRIPPVLDWTSIPYNLHEDDEKFLTNIPFLGDEFIEKDTNFIDEMVTLYEGKIHQDEDSNKFRRMDDQVFYELVQAMIKIEAKEGPQIFKEEGLDTTEGVAEVNEEDISNTWKNSVYSPKKATIPELAAKIVTSPKASCSGGKPLSPLESQVPKTEENATITKTDDACPMEIDCVKSQDSPKKIEASEDDKFTINEPSDQIFAILSTTFSGLGSRDEIKERYENVKKSHDLNRDAIPLPIMSNGLEQQRPESYGIPNIEGPCAKYLPKQETMNDYRILFCRRCFMYDCKRHTGDDQVDVEHYKNLRTKAISQQTQSFNFFKCENPTCFKQTSTCSRNRGEILKEWGPGDRSLFSSFIDSFPSQYCFISFLMTNKTCEQVKEYADLESPKMESATILASRKPKQRKSARQGFAKKLSSSSSNKSITRRWINNVKKTEKTKEDGGIKSPGGKLPARYIPCVHKDGGECDSSCSCRINKTSCEKFCTCSLSCTYRFPGCKCQSTCDSKRCICFAAARECDPDLCSGCGANEINLEKTTCHNVNIQRKRHKHLLMGKSDVSGWGIYIKDDAQKGEFIAEYRGELISHDESERRGHVYDKIQHTFLFELNDHFVVDATRKGNKARFVNSSRNPNCEVKRMLVNGDHRIGIYAKRYIEAGEELFYDYEDVLEKQQKASEGARRKK